MGKRLSKKESWFKQNAFTTEDEIYVGVDVHKRHYHVAIWHNGRIGCVYSMSSDNNRLLRDVQKMGSSLKNIVYEAGPTGYGLVRLLRSANLPAEVVAVSKTPRMTDTSAKTDRLDCQQLKPAIYPSWRSYETYLLAVSSNRACLPSNGMNAGRLSAGAVIRNVGRKGAGQASQKKVETQ